MKKDERRILLNELTDDLEYAEKVHVSSKKTPKKETG